MSLNKDFNQEKAIVTSQVRLEHLPVMLATSKLCEKC
jgi:hypothetical protein